MQKLQLTTVFACIKNCELVSLTTAYMHPYSDGLYCIFAPGCGRERQWDGQMRLGRLRVYCRGHPTGAHITHPVFPKLGWGSGALVLRLNGVGMLIN